MKKIFFVVLSLVLCSFVFSCGISTPKTTVDDVISNFDENTYLVQKYDEVQISEISAKLDLEDEIITIVHIINKNTSSPGLEWTYVYEFSSGNDAAWFEKNRTVFVSNIENGKCVKLGNIIVYGNSDVIYDLTISK